MLKVLYSRLFALSLLLNCSMTSFCNCEEVFDSVLEASALKNIRQLTFSSMGFEKAGEAYFSTDGKNIVFQAVPNGQKQYQIYAMNIEEGIPHMVSTGYGACTCAFFKPDGKKIIFASSHDDPILKGLNTEITTPGYKREGGQYAWDFTPYMNIYEANPDGSELVALTTGEAYHAECAYSPDGSQIVFASNSSGSMNIYTMKADGSEVKQITHTSSSYNGGPFFSPDGKQIVFRSDREKPHYLQIFTINSDGSNESQVTSNDAVNWAPYWYPNGKAIAYTTSIHGHMHYEVYMLNPTTGAQQRITHNASFDGMPVFSNDGSKIMWTSKRGSEGACQIFIADFVMPQSLK